MCKLIVLERAAPLAHKFEMAKGQRQIRTSLVKANSIVSRLFPARAGQTNIRAMGAGTEKCAAAGIPATEKQRAIKARQVGRVRFQCKLMRQVPSGGAAFVEAQCLPDG